MSAKSNKNYLAFASYEEESVIGPVQNVKVLEGAGGRLAVYEDPQEIAAFWYSSWNGSERYSQLYVRKGDDEYWIAGSSTRSDRTYLEKVSEEVDPLGFKYIRSDQVPSDVMEVFNKHF